MRILIVSTLYTTIKTFLKPHIKLLNEKGYIVDLACNFGDDLDTDYNNEFHINKKYNLKMSRNPLSFGNYVAYKKLKKIIIKENYEIIHTHTPVASVITRLANTNKNSNSRVFYTAHGFHFYKGSSLLSKLFIYPLEKYLSKYTDTLITINQEDYNFSIKHMKAKNILYVPGVGINTEKFKKSQNLKKIRQSLEINESDFILTSIGELNNNKNHVAVIKAMSLINDKNIHYLICGRGMLEQKLKRMINDYGLSKKVHILGFRNDICDILSISDVFIFPSFREGLAVSLMEAMSIGMPIICSNIRGNVDLVDDGLGGYLINPRDSKEIAEKILMLYRDENLRNKMSKYNNDKVNSFNINNVLNIMGSIYDV